MHMHILVKNPNPEYSERIDSSTEHSGPEGKAL